MANMAQKISMYIKLFKINDKYYFSRLGAHKNIETVFFIALFIIPPVHIDHKRYIPSYALPIQVKEDEIHSPHSA